MSRPLPWDDIGVPTVDYTVRLVAAAGAIPVFWGRDTTGRCLLIVELHPPAGIEEDELCSSVELHFSGAKDNFVSPIPAIKLPRGFE